MVNVRQFLKAFLLIFLCTTFIALFSFSGGKAIDTFYGNQNEFPKGTYIGSVPISGLTVEEAEEKLVAEIKNWKNSTNYKLVYFDELVELPGNHVQFFVNESLQMVDDGYGELLNTISETIILETIDQFSYYIPLDELHIEAIQEAVKIHAASLVNTPLYIDVNEHVGDRYETEQVARATISNVESTLLLEQWVKNLNGTVIEAREAFSLLQTMKETGAVIIEGESLNVLATALYETFLQTNFQIRERHIGSTLPDYAKLGFHAVVQPDLADLIVVNRNFYPYTLLFSYEDNMLSVSLEGISFPFSFSAVTKNERIVTPRKIVHFSAEKEADDRQVMRNGKNGYFAEVYHQQRNKDSNELINEQLLFEDFYPPVHRIELWSLQDKPSDEQTLGDNGPGQEDEDSASSITDGNEGNDEAANGDSEENKITDPVQKEDEDENELGVDDEGYGEEPMEDTKGY